MTQKITQNQVTLPKTVDANGWTVYDHGTFKEYRKRVTFSVTVNLGPTSFPVSSTNLPVGVSNINTHYLDYSITATGNAGGLNVVYEGTGTTTILNFVATSTDVSRAYTGFMDVTLTGS
jgi:hypothetical protein